MKRFTLLSVLLAGFAIGLQAQSNQYKVVFDITSKDSSDHKAVLRHAAGMADSYKGSDVEVVVYGGAITMVLKDKSIAASDVEKLATSNVKIKVCAVTMKRYNIDKSMLIPGVEVVPDAIVEIITKQGAGWGYIKEAH